MPATLSSARRTELRAEAHKLKPLVLIGDKGLTDAVVAEAERALKAHELIKVRASTDDREARKAWMGELATRLEAHAVQVIGKILVLYRENVEKREAEKAAARLAAKPRTKRPARERAAPKPEPTGKVRTKAGKKPSLWTKKPREAVAATGTSRRQSRTPSPRPASGPRRRPRSTSR